MAEAKPSQVGQDAKPELSPASATCHRRQRGTGRHARSLPLLTPAPLGHPPGAKPFPHLQKYRQGRECRNQQGRKQSATAVARAIPEDLQAMKCLHLWCRNVRPSCLTSTYHKHVLKQVVCHEFRRLHFLFSITPNKKNCKGGC